MKKPPPAPKGAGGGFCFCGELRFADVVGSLDFDGVAGGIDGGDNVGGRIDIPKFFNIIETFTYFVSVPVNKAVTYFKNFSVFISENMPPVIAIAGIPGKTYV